MTWPLFLGALLLGLIQGLTEFIPVSSSGHLILADRVLGYEREIGGHLRVVVFEVVIQLGSTAAILAVYGRELWGTARRLFSVAPTAGAADGTRHLQLGWALVIGTVPVVVVGGLWGGAIQSHLYSPAVVAWSFIIGGGIIWLVESLPIRVTTTSTGTLTVRQALWVGLAQVQELRDLPDRLWPAAARDHGLTPVAQARRPSARHHGSMADREQDLRRAVVRGPQSGFQSSYMTVFIRVLRWCNG